MGVGVRIGVGYFPIQEVAVTYKYLIFNIID